MTRPGIYKRGEIEYDRIEAVNISSLLWMAKSAKHYKCRPRKDSSAMRLGTAAHAAALEPERFATQFAVWTERAKNGNMAPRKGQAWDAFCLLHSGSEIITAEERDAAESIASAVRSDDTAMEVLCAGHAEVTFVWIHPTTGILCKGRMDWVDWENERLALSDLKTARDVDPGPFFQAAARLHYHTKMAWYSDGLRIALGTDQQPDTTVIAVESGKPHDVVVYELDEDIIDAGRFEYENLMTKLDLCRANNEWKGIAGGARMRYTIPRWAQIDPEDEPVDGLDWSTT